LELDFLSPSTFAYGQQALRLSKYCKIIFNEDFCVNFLHMDNRLSDFLSKIIFNKDFCVNFSFKQKTLSVFQISNEITHPHVVPNLSMEGPKALRFHQKYLHLCSEEKPVLRVWNNIRVSNS